MISRKTLAREQRRRSTDKQKKKTIEIRRGKSLNIELFPLITTNSVDRKSKAKKVSTTVAQKEKRKRPTNKQNEANKQKTDK